MRTHCSLSLHCHFLSGKNSQTYARQISLCYQPLLAADVCMLWCYCILKILESQSAHLSCVSWPCHTSMSLAIACSQMRIVRLFCQLRSGVAAFVSTCERPILSFSCLEAMPPKSSGERRHGIEEMLSNAEWHKDQAYKAKLDLDYHTAESEQAAHHHACSRRSRSPRRSPRRRFLVLLAGGMLRSEPERRPNPMCRSCAMLKAAQDRLCMSCLSKRDEEQQRRARRTRTRFCLSSHEGRGHTSFPMQGVRTRSAWCEAPR